MSEIVRQILPAFDATPWNKEQQDLVKRLVCPRGISDDEFKLFMHQCLRSGLDPILKQAFCVVRRLNIGSKEHPNWIEKREFQPAEAGMLARAEQFPDFRGVSAAAVREKDHCKIDRVAGTVEHVVNPCEDRGDVIGAWAIVRREGRVPRVWWLDVDAYKQNSPLWQINPDRMAEKCAVVAGLRFEYPGPFGGLYIKEELPEEEADPGPVVHGTVNAAPPAATKTEVIRGQVLAKLPGGELSARVSRLPVQDESKGPDKAPASVTVDASKPKAAPHEEVAALAKGYGIATGRELLAVLGIERAKRSDVTAEDVARARAYVTRPSATVSKDFEE